MSDLARITKPGIYTDFPVDAYFADPCPEPSLTQSIAKILIEKSPAHARLDHPRLCPPLLADNEPVAEKYDPAKAIGNAAHALMLWRGKQIAEAKYPNFLSKEAKAFRDAPENESKVVILSKHLRRAAAMVNAARDAIDLTDWHEAFTDGTGEAVITWQDDGYWMRSMIDWKAPRACYDYKTSGMSVAPHSIGSMIEDGGWHIQAAIHERGLAFLEPGNRQKFRFLAQENYAPYAVTPIELDEHWLTMGRKKLQFAIDVWRQCIKTDIWPAYPLQPSCPPYPGYREQQWLEREVKDAARERLPADNYSGSPIPGNGNGDPTPSLMGG